MKSLPKATIYGEYIGPEPLSVEQVQQYLRLEHSEDNAQLQRLITAARERGEQLLGQFIRLRQVSAVYDYAPKLRLVPRPLHAVEWVSLLARKGEWQVISRRQYQISEDILQLEVACNQEIKIDFSVGYTSESPGYTLLQQYLLMLVAALYVGKLAAEMQATEALISNLCPLKL